MVKKIIVLGVVLIMCIGIFCGCGNDKEWTLLESSECHEPFEMSDVYWNNYPNSTTVYEEAITQFTTIDGKYTDDFGGSYIDSNGIYNICVVGSREPVKSDYLIYKRVDNSYNFLESIVEEIGKISQEFNIWKSANCNSCNRVLICLEKESKISLIIEHLKTKNLFKKDSLNFFVGQNEIVPN